MESENKAPVAKKAKSCGSSLNTFSEPSEKINEVKTSEVAPEKTPELKELPSLNVDTKDEYNIEVIMDYDGKVDPFYLSKKDEEYEYRFIRADDKNLSIKTGNLLFQKGGWQIVPRDHLVKLGIQERYYGKDGIYRVGDTVLARMPKELWLKKRSYKRKQNQDKMTYIHERRDKGIPNDPELTGVGHPNMKGLQTADDLGLK